MDRSDAPGEERYLGLTATQLNLAFFAAVGAIGLGAAVYFGAVDAVQDYLGGEPSSDGASVAESARPTAEAVVPTTTATLTAEEAAQSSLLTLNDFPSGWTAAPADDDEEGESDFPVSEECSILNELEHPAGEIAGADSGEFEGPERQEASSDSTVFSTDAAAQEALEAFNDGLTRCRDEFVTAFETALLEEWDLTEGDTRLSGLHISVQDLEFPGLGESMTAYRIEITTIVDEVIVPFVIDFVVIRTGRMVGGFSYLSVGSVNSFEEERLAEVVAEKLGIANASLVD
jgi:hypothetical protein